MSALPPDHPQVLRLERAAAREAAEIAQAAEDERRVGPRRSHFAAYTRAYDRRMYTAMVRARIEAFFAAYRTGGEVHEVVGRPGRFNIYLYTSYTGRGDLEHTVRGNNLRKLQRWLRENLWEFCGFDCESMKQSNGLKWFVCICMSA